MTGRGTVGRCATSAAVAVLGAGGLAAAAESARRRLLWDTYRGVMHSYERMRALVAAHHLHTTLHQPVPPPALSLGNGLREAMLPAAVVLAAFALGGVLVVVGHRRLVVPAVVALLYASPVYLGLDVSKATDALSVAVAALVVLAALWPLLGVTGQRLQPRSRRMTVAAWFSLGWVLWLGWSVSGGFDTGQDTATGAALLAVGLLLGASPLPLRWLLPVAFIGALAMPDLAADLAYGTLTWAGRLSTLMSGVLPLCIGFALARWGGRAWDGLRKLGGHGPELHLRRPQDLPV